MTKLDELIDAYANCISGNKTVVRKLNDKIEEIESFKVKCATAKTVGTVATVVGGIGLVAAPFTGGLSALVTGVVGTLGGLATNVITDFINSSETKQFISELEDYNGSRRKDTERLAKLLEELSKSVQGFKESGLSDEDSLTHAILNMAGKNPVKLLKSGTYRKGTSLSVSKLFELGSASTKIYICNLLVMRTLSTALGIKGLDALGNVIKGFSTATTKAAGAALKTLASVATIVFVVIDVVLLVKEWSGDHVAADYGTKMVSQLQEETQCYGEMQKQLLKFKTCLEELDEDSVDSDDDECTCSDVELSVFYVNIQSMRPDCQNTRKLREFCSHIAAKQPDIVAIVETWLSPEIHTTTVQTMWNLQNYELFRYDRQEERRGGGILVGWNRAKLASMDFDFNSDTELSQRMFDYNKDFLRFFFISKYFSCSKCRKVGLIQGSGLRTYSFVVLYRRPGAYRKSTTQPPEDREDFREQDAECVSYLFDFFQGSGGFASFSRSAGVIVGDFNWTEKKWENYIEGIPTLFRIPTTGHTYRNITSPDGVIAVPPDFVFPPMIPVFDCGTEHKALSFKLKFGKDYPQSDPCPKCFP